jgi:rSAM/selenodomain-associated transferase 1
MYCRSWIKLWRESFLRRMKTTDLTALIIFVRNPIYGKVKTRLAKDIGDDNALKVYYSLLKHTLNITQPINCSKFVYYADEVTYQDIWDIPGYSKRLQEGNDLGERMYHAMKDAFDSGFTKVLIVGSDCFQIKTEIIEKAIVLLNHYSAVLGPAIDGGYYLLALANLIPDLFFNKAWSTDQVSQQTISDFNRIGISYDLLEELNDIDDGSDLEDYIINN